ncbi:MAG: (d)CMP kinase [Rikenellaceae bacterium]
MEQFNSTDRLIIAIDGFSSCGKSSFAKAIAAKLGYVFIDTGAMYRAVALMTLRSGVVDNDNVNEQGVEDLLPSINITFEYNPSRQASDIYINGEKVEDQQIRTIEVNGAVSRISTIAAVRQKLVSLQQSMGKKGGVVMDGRDIGTVVFPSAHIKLYMTADPTIRAQRRFDELTQNGEEVSFEQIKENIISRDNADLTRQISPLRRADDAIELDNSHMTIPEQMEWFMEIYNRKINKTKE